MSKQVPKVKRFKRPKGHQCKVSTGIHDCLTFGTGELNDNGFWEHSCEACARAYEQQFPEDGPCWPHTQEQLKQMGFERVKPHQITDKQVMETRNSLEMMKRPHLWCRWPALPVKRWIGQNLQTGIMTDTDHSKFRYWVYEGNIFMIHDSIDVTEANIHKYDSPEAVVADGWVVD